jgi:hypothetical protein
MLNLTLICVNGQPVVTQARIVKAALKSIYLPIPTAISEALTSHATETVSPFQTLRSYLNRRTT